MMAAAAATPDIAHIEPLNSRADIIVGTSCNVVVIRSADGLLLVDDQGITDFAETMRLLRTRSQLPVKRVINTHFHLDHAGGNAQFARDGAVVMAQQNVQVRLGNPKLDERYRAKFPGQGTTLAPSETYTDRAKLSFGAEKIELVHIANAHTDGDSIVKLKRANVIHLGDLFFSGMFPHIDTDTGGTIQGNIHALNVALEMSDDRTRIVPGHGPVTDRASLKANRDMLVDVMENVRSQMAAGHSLAEIIASHPTAPYKLDGDTGDIERFITAIHQGLTNAATAK